MKTKPNGLLLAAVTAMLLLTSSQTLAGEPSASPIAAYGEATSSCGSFVESRQNETQRYIYLAWLNGYLTAVNKYQSGIRYYDALGDIKAGRDSQALMLWLENYCRENPLDSFFRAVLMLQNELQRK